MWRVNVILKIEKQYLTAGGGGSGGYINGKNLALSHIHRFSRISLHFSVKNNLCLSVYISVQLIVLFTCPSCCNSVQLMYVQVLSVNCCNLCVNQSWCFHAGWSRSCIIPSHLLVTFSRRTFGIWKISSLTQRYKFCLCRKYVSDIQRLTSSE